MADTATTRGRLRKQTLASNVNIWGDPYLNTNFDLLDQQIDGVTTIALSTSTATTLTSTNYGTDQQRNKVWVFTGTGTQTCTATVPQVEQVKLVVNQSAGPVVIAPAAGSSVTVAAGERAWVYNDGTNFGRGDPTLDKVRAPTGPVSMNGQRLTNLAAGTASSDAMRVGEAQTFVDTASAWANTTGSAVTGTLYSAQAWAIGGSGVPPAGAAKLWAQQFGSSVDGTGYSAKEWSAGTRTTVDGTYKSARAYAVDGSAQAGTASAWAGTAAGWSSTASGWASTASGWNGTASGWAGTASGWAGTAAAWSTSTTTVSGGYKGAYAYALEAAASAASVTPPATVLMYRTADGGNDPNVSPATWVVRKPDGSLLSTTGTTTMGLQEAITYAIGNGYSLIVEGGGVKGSAPSGIDPAIIHCTTAISFPPMQKGYVSIRGVTINFDGSPAGSPYGINIDSMMMGRIEFPGSQIVAYASAYAGAVNVNPVNPVPIDNVAVITDSVIDLCTTVAYPGATCVQLYAGTNGIASNEIRIMEPNGGAVGVLVVAGSGAGAFYDNQISVIDAHLQTTTCVAVGNGTTGATNIFSNFWTIGCDPATGATGVSIYGTYDQYKIAVRNEEGTPAVGIVLQSSAAGNIIDAPIIEATTKLTDSSSTKGNTIRVPRDIAVCNLANTNQTGVANATWTVINFSNCPQNTQSSFSTSTHQYTVPYTGFYDIRAIVSFATIGDQTPIGISIYVNGAQSRQAFATASGTDSNVSAAISVILQLNAGAVVDIRAIQSSGGALDIAGDNKRTHASFVKID